MNLNSKLYVLLYSLTQTSICYTHVKVRSKYKVTYPVFNEILKLLIIIPSIDF